MRPIYLIPIFFVLYGLTLAMSTARGEEPVTRQAGWQLAQGRWESDAERQLGLGRGMGRRLVTQDEWEEHQSKMQNLSPEERERYRQEWHAKMVERARERGIDMPETPGPWRGRAPGGMGRGGGMGKGRGMGPRGW